MNGYCATRRMGYMFFVLDFTTGIGIIRDTFAKRLGIFCRDFWSSRNNYYAYLGFQYRILRVCTLCLYLVFAIVAFYLLKK